MHELISDCKVYIPLLKIYMELLATGNSHCSLDVLYGDVSLKGSRTTE